MGQGLFSRYERNKERRENETLEDKEKRKESQRKSFQKNKQKRYVGHNIYNKQIREIWKERGLCSKCGKEKENMKKSYCFKCREYHKNYYRKYKK